MNELAWENIITGIHNSREVKPRKTGTTMVMDVGKGISETLGILQTTSNYIDLWKFGFGTSVFLEKTLLQEKLKLLKSYDVLTFPGGTLLEVALLQHHCRVFMTHAKSLGFSAVEISDGTIPLPAFRRKKVIQCAIDAGLIPITEVGKKDPKRQPTTEQIAEEALQDLEWGAAWVIVEGRESGQGVGIFDASGKVEESYIDRIVDIMGSQINALIWEAPLKNQQAYLIEKFGGNTGLGNICPDQVLAVEALRNGLRFDTLDRVSSQLVRRGDWDPNQAEHDDELAGNAVVRLAGKI